MYAKKIMLHNILSYYASTVVDYQNYGQIKRHKRSDSIRSERRLMSCYMVSKGIRYQPEKSKKVFITAFQFRKASNTAVAGFNDILIAN
jgi:hypothetical protein